jgi:hypothetical protein
MRKLAGMVDSPNKDSLDKLNPRLSNNIDEIQVVVVEFKV